MKCVVNVKWDDGLWISEAKTEQGEPIGLTLESGSFDALVERVKIAMLEMLELNFGYVGNVEVSFQTERTENLRAISWKPREIS
ncbi:MAG: DUF1902 domain-containing protein [Defluviitaleaceae bacterium]|nr:DUF1902 domain-containing protein [Defluviitaleaceae bacterium]